MNRNYYWKWAIVALVIVWSLAETYPPTSLPLWQEFSEKGQHRDAAFTNMVERLEKLPVDAPFTNVMAIIGTNDLTHYFPDFAEAAKDRDTNRAIIFELQKAGAGKIHLGLDLQGGTSFVLQMQQPSPLAQAFDAKGTNRDGAFATIMEHLKTVLADEPLTNILAIIGTNDLTKYFPMYPEAAKDRQPNRAILLKLQDTAGSQSDVSGKIARAVEELRKRVDAFGVAEPVIQPEGVERVQVQLPGLSESVKENARISLQKAAFLEIKLVHPDSDGQILKDIPTPGYKFYPFPHQARNGQPVPGYLLTDKAALTGEHITQANMIRDNSGQPEVNFRLDGEGADIFGKLTTDNVGRDLAIVLDGELQSSPAVIKEPIPGGSVRISGHYTDKEAEDLADILQNPLPAPLKLLSETSVDPRLGTDTVHSGVMAAVIGTVLVAGFMVCYYLLAGFVADIALITNIIILMGVMCFVGTTLTLPGIAGIVLTIGMAVDANVLIFERIREESAKGKSLRGALQAGYDRAFGTIFDSHVTTLISSIILIYLGTGPIKGFGVTLTIGVAASLFTALVVTRLIFDFLLAKGWIKSLKMFHFIRATKLDFMKLAAPAFILSWTIIVVGVGYGGYRAFVKHDLMGIDFVGGDHLTLAFTNQAARVDQEKIGAAITKNLPDVQDPVIQYQSGAAGSGDVLSVVGPFGSGDKIAAVLEKEFPATGFTMTGGAIEKVGPIIGEEIQYTAVTASLVSLLGILFYVALRYEFSFAVGAVVAVLHDVLMTIGCYCLTELFAGPHQLGRQFNATMLAAVLTIIGFSINDTIVIFDRIREDLKLGVRGSFKELMNQALNQTLSRTIITSGTVFLATTSLFLFGGGAINDFAFTFLIGIITGTYSSIYIASALVLWWHHGQRPKTGTQIVMTEPAGQTGTGVAART